MRGGFVFEGVVIDQRGNVLAHILPEGARYGQAVKMKDALRPALALVLLLGYRGFDVAGVGVAQVEIVRLIGTEMAQMKMPAFVQSIAKRFYRNQSRHKHRRLAQIGFSRS